MNKPQQWTCGHVAGAMCLECHRLLAVRAHELAVENLALRQKHEMALDTLARLGREHDGIRESYNDLITRLEALCDRAEARQRERKGEHAEND